MKKVIIDSSVFSDYVASYIIKDDEITCEYLREDPHGFRVYYCKTKDKNILLTDGSIKSLTKMYNGKIEQIGRDKIKIKFDRKTVDDLKRISKTLKNLCKVNDCMVTPDFGVSIGKGMVNPFTMKLYGRPIYEKTEDFWNLALRYSLDELNAKILLDKDLKKFVGDKEYNNLLDYFNKEFGNVYTDEEGILSPRIVMHVSKGLIQDTIEIDVQDGKIWLNGKLISEKWKDQPALKEIFKSLVEGSKSIQEISESIKTIIFSGEKMKKYYRGKGIIDVYLKGISRDEDVIVLTKDKDIALDMGVNLRGGDLDRIKLIK